MLAEFFVEVDALLKFIKVDVFVVGVCDLNITRADKPDGSDGGEVCGVGVKGHGAEVDVFKFGC